MAFGFGFGMPRIFSVARFSPLSLFSGGAPGAWYDPSDYGATGTLFQDSAGTTPVTAVEQPVGLMLDKSQGLVLGPDVVINGDFSNGITGWTAAGSSIAVVGGEFEITVTAGGWLAFQNFTTVVGKTYKLTATMRAAETNSVAQSCRLTLDSPSVQSIVSANGVQTSVSFYFTATTTSTRVNLGVASGGAVGAIGDKAYFDIVVCKELAGNHAFQATSASRPVLSARYNLLTATETLSTQSVTTAATTHTLRFTGAGSITLTGTAIGVYTAGTYSVTTTAGSLTLTVLGTVTQADLRVANNGITQPAYQRVNTATDYATTGFLPYLKFDGVDDSLSTNSISFTSTDKMSVFAGVRKLSDAAYGALAEFSNNADTSSGAFVIWAPIVSKYQWQSRGTNTSVASTTSTIYNAPVTNTLTSFGDISGDLATLRINGAQVAQNTGDQGTGNYGNYPLYIGRRAGSSFPFNGQLYSMIIVGKAVTAGELSSTETYTASKTGVVLA